MERERERKRESGEYQGYRKTLTGEEKSKGSEQITQNLSIANSSSSSSSSRDMCSRS